MKKELRKKLEEKRERIAAGTNNGWLNFALPIDCKGCAAEIGAGSSYCHFRGDYLTKEKGCVKKAYEAKQK